jgi:YVTN family beta-propeller protein
LDKTAGKLYLTYIQDKGLGVLDVKTQRATTIPVGTIPSAVAVNEKTGQVYVTNYDDGTVSVIDGREGRVVATVAVGQHPSAVAVDVARDLVIVANTKDSTLSLIDGKTRKVRKTVKAGEHPYAIAIDDKTQKMYVANVNVANPEEKTFTAIPLGGR